jgi:hypothetical protein
MGFQIRPTPEFRETLKEDAAVAAILAVATDLCRRHELEMHERLDFLFGL